MDEVVSVPAPALGLHVDVGLRGGRVAWCRFAREATAPTVADAPSEAARHVAAAIARHVATGREDLARVAVDLSGVSPFHREVLETLRERVPAGSVVTYGELAALCGRGPEAARAVGGAMAANPIPLVVPCHRVVPAGGPLGNYSGLGGVATKRALLRLERAPFQDVLFS